MKTDGSSRYDDLTLAELVEHALALNEGQLSAKGALVVSTERKTPVQRFIVNEPSVSDVIWTILLMCLPFCFVCGGQFNHLPRWRILVVLLDVGDV